MTALLATGCGGDGERRATPEPAPAETSASADTCAPILEDAATIAVDMSSKGLAGKIRDLNSLADQAAAECPLAIANDVETAVEEVESTHDSLNLCAVERCDIQKRADAYGDAVEQLRRSVATG